MIRSILVAAAALASSGTALAQPYVFGGLSGTDSWSWGGVGLDDLRGAVANPMNFGPGGTVGWSATTTQFSSLTPDALAAIDCFVAPAVWEWQYTPSQITMVRDWFLAGGDLLLMNDRFDFDSIGEALGLPTTDGPGFGSGVFTATVTGPSPLSNGPFGGVSTFDQQYSVGHLTPAHVVAANGQIAATNTMGVAAAFWDRGAFGPAAGRMVIVSDVDVFTDRTGYSGGSDYAVMNANAVFSLNTMAFFVPAPGVSGVVLLGASMFLRRRR